MSWAIALDPDQAYQAKGRILNKLQNTEEMPDLLRNHLEMLKDSDLIYSEIDVVDKMLNIKELAGKEQWSDRVKQYAPDVVMNKFEEVFLK